MTRRACPVFHTIALVQWSALVRCLRLNPKWQPTTVLLTSGFMHSLHSATSNSREFFCGRVLKKTLLLCSTFPQPTSFQTFSMTSRIISPSIVPPVLCVRSPPASPAGGPGWGRCEVSNVRHVEIPLRLCVRAFWLVVEDVGDRTKHT